MQTNSLVLIIVVAVIGGAWTEREAIKKHWQEQFQPQSSEKSSQTKVYTWKDSEGTVHYSKNADDKKAKELTVDTSKISRLEPLPPPKEAAKEKDKLLIMEMREELIRNRDKMQAAKEKQIMGE